MSKDTGGNAALNADLEMVVPDRLKNILNAGFRSKAAIKEHEKARHNPEVDALVKAAKRRDVREKVKQRHISNMRKKVKALFSVQGFRVVSVLDEAYYVVQIEDGPKGYQQFGYLVKGNTPYKRPMQVFGSVHATERYIRKHLVG